MTTLQQVNTIAIIRLYNRNRSYQSVRQKYGINYNCVAVLLSCYLYSTTVKSLFSFNELYLYINKLYNYPLLKKHINSLIDCSLVSITQGGRHNLYSLSNSGYSAIQEISQRSDNLLYSFCSKYGIEL